MTGRREASAVETIFNFPGSIAVITGASSGLGRRIALDVAARGATVIGVARREELLQQVAAEMRRSSPASGYVVCDVSDTDKFASVLSDLEAAHGRIDLLVNDAGIGEPEDRKSTRLNSSHANISYAVFCLK